MTHPDVIAALRTLQEARQRRMAAGLISDADWRALQLLGRAMEHIAPFHDVILARNRVTLPNREGGTR